LVEAVNHTLHTPTKCRQQVFSFFTYARALPRASETLYGLHFLTCFKPSRQAYKPFNSLLSTRATKHPIQLVACLQLASARHINHLLACLDRHQPAYHPCILPHIDASVALHIRNSARIANQSHCNSPAASFKGQAFTQIAVFAEPMWRLGVRYLARATITLVRERKPNF
jgi:hypothetical protein